jgi:hypothetical protein
MTQYRAKIEMDFIIHDWDRAREIALEFAKTLPNLVSAIPGETRDQFARRIVGDDKLVADTLAMTTLVKGAMELAAADIGNIALSLTPSHPAATDTAAEPTKLQNTWLVAQALAHNGGTSSTQLLPNEQVQLTVNGTTAEGSRWLIVQRLQLVDAAAEKLSPSDEGSPVAPA